MDTWSFGHLVLFLTAWMGPPRYRIPGFQELHSTYRDVLWLVRISEKNLLHIRNIFCVGDPSRIFFRKKRCPDQTANAQPTLPVLQSLQKVLPSPSRKLSTSMIMTPANANFRLGPLAQNYPPYGQKNPCKKFF